ncbi:DNA cytosine methyltransferase [Streptomyces sp. SAJ15]|uniref:DNA cytosine methyltransferase n=1 Tax=Streptomyces sp. SAJ15 TaxID=2011095 RepID=UPI001184E973|nr:DNA cytosine methyltransferase [Streptomyces sp. SAJ15]TVL89816.1 DNA methyltransferase [Streptomyces sp. SAJ15]
MTNRASKNKSRAATHRPATRRRRFRHDDLVIGSVCTGYGGLDEAVQQVFGGQLAWAADVDPGACRIIAHRMPGVPNLGDITTLDWRQVEPVDIFIGGYPCQPFSLAGDLKGTDDDRHLWPFIARALGVLRPRIAVFENVANHLRLGFDTVLCDLADLGFDVEWDVVRADEVGAPHQRRRLIVLATAPDTPGPGLSGAWVRGRTTERSADIADASGQQPERRGESGVLGSAATAQPGQGHQWQRAGNSARDRREAVADASDLGHERGGSTRGGRPGPEDGRIPAAHAESIGRGEGRPEPARQQGRPGAAFRRRAATPDAQGRSRPDGPVGGPELQLVAEPGTSSRVGERRGTEGTDEPGRGASVMEWGQYAPAVARWEGVTGRCAPRATDDRRRLSPAFVEWMMGLPAGHVTDVPGLTRTQQLKALGNGVVPQQAVAAIRLLADRAGVAA